MSGPARPWDRCYWVDTDLLLAGQYPGGRTEEETRERMNALHHHDVQCIVNLMEPDEVNHEGELFLDYVKAFEEIGREREIETRYRRFPIPDLGVTTVERMKGILDAIDAAHWNEMRVYLHCWGGVGRTGTVVGCWLRRHHEYATRDNILQKIQRLRLPDAVWTRPSPETAAQRAMVLDWERGM